MAGEVSLYGPSGFLGASAGEWMAGTVFLAPSVSFPSFWKLSAHHITKQKRSRRGQLVQEDEQAATMLGQTVVVWQKPKSGLRRSWRRPAGPWSSTSPLPWQDHGIFCEYGSKHRKEYFRELASKKSGHNEGGRARAQEPSGYEKTDKITKHKTTLTNFCSWV